MLKGLRKKASLLLISSQSLSHSVSSSQSNDSYDKVLKQVHDFEIALKAMDYLLDDRTQEGIRLLESALNQQKEQGSDHPAAIFPLAQGVMEFIEATLGFEPEMMAKAHKTLSDAESSQLINSKYNLKYNLSTSYIYPPGTEFQVTFAELTLLNALVMLLTENNGMVESAKALFKLRRAYQTLDSVYKKIRDLEATFNKNLSRLKKESLSNMNNISTADLPGYKATPASSRNNSSASLPQDIKLMKELEKVYQMRKSRIEGTNLGNISSAKVNLFQNLPGGLVSSVNLNRQSSSTYLRPRSESPVWVANSAFAKDVESDLESSDDDADFSDAVGTLEELNELCNASGSQFSHLELSAIVLGEGSILESVMSSSTNNLSSSAYEQEHDSYLHVSTTDEFIHSGVQLCFGILQVVLSLIPPTIGKVLSIVGFKGDKEIGLKMLWRTAITSRNIHGALALLCLLVFYDGPIQFVDVGYQLPGQEDENVKDIISLEGKASVSEDELLKILENPALYTPQILTKARNIFPHNALWVLQEGRMLAAAGKLHQATDMMQKFTDDPANTIQMQQIEALLVFDRAMYYSFLHEFDRAAEDYISLISLNSWSKGVYLFLAAASYLGKYRMIQMDLIKVDDKEAELEKYADLAETYLKLAPTYVPGHGHNASGKKGGIGGGNKQMPFDKFLLRKVAHIEARKLQYPGVPLVDLVGTSLIHELIYFWNGYNRMTLKELELTLTILGYSGAPNSELSANNDELNYAKIDESRDEAMIRYFLQSIALRLLNKIDEGLAVLNSHVISKYLISESPTLRFTKMTYSPYLYPTAVFEKTMFIWKTKAVVGNELESLQTIEECRAWLRRAELVGEGDYELSNRTGMKIKAAEDRLASLAAVCS
jgi:hypothetical protein